LRVLAAVASLAGTESERGKDLETEVVELLRRDAKLAQDLEEEGRTDFAAPWSPTYDHDMLVFPPPSEQPLISLRPLYDWAAARGYVEKEDPINFRWRHEVCGDFPPTAVRQQAELPNIFSADD